MHYSRRFIPAVGTCLMALILGASSPAVGSVNTDHLSVMKYRSLGPYRGGRVTAVTGVVSDPKTFFMGSTGGGVWKTRDSGASWSNVSDKFFEAGSIGAIAVAESDPNVVYVGTGSACPRGNVSAGNGVYKSTDAGKSWKHIGLPEAGQIGRIRVHPQDDNLVYVAVLGHIFGPNEDRGVYRSKDGGTTWEKVLFVSAGAGAVDLSLNPHNPREIYASIWQAERKPFTMVSGGDDSGLYKTSDGGDTWTELTKGLPTSTMGKIGVSLSPANPNRVWALIEADQDQGGVYRSDNGGESFTRINTQRDYLQRAWYYTHIVADPDDENTVYILNVGFYRSVDGGKNFEFKMIPHGDNHDLWIHPKDSNVMIQSNDGGANVTVNGGQSWSTQTNQPTGEFYRVETDHRFPYWVYGSQQDNTTVRIASRTRGFGITGKDWHQVGGCESGHIAIDPRNPNADIVYAGCFGGSITRYDHATGVSREITDYPQLALGQAPRDLRYRFQWNAPIHISTHDPAVLYHTSNYVHKSLNEGQSWVRISPDLTTNNPETLDFGGGPITRDNTGVEVYGTIFAFEESPLVADMLWAGSDDGRVHLTRDGGATWQEVTPPDLPEFATVNSIDPSPHVAGRAHVAIYRYRFDDFTPFIFQTNDYGETWKRIADGTRGIGERHFVRVVREDNRRQGLLYAGTEYGVYFSRDDGESWQSLQLNLPVTPVTDLRIREDDLVLSTQGRGFWILDDIDLLQQMEDGYSEKEVALFQPPVTYRFPGFGFNIPLPSMGQNPPGGAVIRYFLKEKPEGELKLEIVDPAGNVVRSLSSTTPEDKAPNLFAAFFGGGSSGMLTANAGMNQWVWDLRHQDAKMLAGTIMWGFAQGPYAVPGDYQARMSVSGTTESVSFQVNPDPRVASTADDYRAQLDLALEVRDLLSGTHAQLKSIRDVKSQVDYVVKILGDTGKDEEGAIRDRGKQLNDKLGEVENKLYQTDNQAFQDPLNFQPMLDNQIAGLYGVVLAAEGRPTDGSFERYNDLKAVLEGYRQELSAILSGELVSFNQAVMALQFAPVLVGSSP